MTRIRYAWVAAALFMAAFSLPFYFFQHRSERLRCQGGFDYEHCVAGTPYTLVLPMGLIGKPADIPYADPPTAFFVNGIYARQGYSASTAKIGGLAIPLVILCIAACLTFRVAKRPKVQPPK